jgi:hypothetical protein
VPQGEKKHCSGGSPWQNARIEDAGPKQAQFDGSIDLSEFPASHDSPPPSPYWIVTGAPSGNAAKLALSIAK